MNYVLKRKDEIITIIDFADDGSVYIFHPKLVNPELAPLHDTNNFDWLKQWWKRRSIPISQGNIRQMLEMKGLLGPEGFLLKNLGLSEAVNKYGCIYYQKIESYDERRRFRMKKAITIIIAVLGVIVAAIGIHWKAKNAVAISIIGGADGPTSVFIAGKVGDGMILGAILLGIILASIGVIVYRKISKK